MEVDFVRFRRTRLAGPTPNLCSDRFYIIAKKRYLRCTLFVHEAISSS